MSTIELSENLNKLKKFPKHFSGDVFEYGDITFDASLVDLDYGSLKPKDILTVIAALSAEDESLLTKDVLKFAAKVYERNSDSIDFFAKNYKEIGKINCYNRLCKPGVMDEISEIEDSLRERFKEEYKGRAPRITHAMATFSYLYGVDEDTIIKSFDMNNVKKMMDSKYLSPLEVSVLMVGAKEIKSPQIFESQSSKYAVKCYCSYFKGQNEVYKNAGDWISNHASSDEKLLRKISKKAEELTLNEDITIDALKAQLGKLSSLSEVEKIEKAYKKTGFKFKDCEFDLKFSDTSFNHYRMEILRPGDTRMVYLGDYTHCCQKLYDAGESAMMHGLLNPHAGFWCMTDERTGRVVAQAEIWEKDGDDNTLVFDNIEFANDAEIGLYKVAIGKWLEDSPYENIYMGVGYNDMLYDGEFRVVDGMHPGVTPYEIYVISHESESEAPIFKSEEEAKEALESGRVTYFDYVYCDSERSTVVMKENNVLEPYFRDPDLENEIDEEEELEEL